MSELLHHDYITLTKMSSMENSSEIDQLSKNRNNDVLKTELSLGLPGSTSPEKKHGVTIFGKDFEEKSQNLKCFYSENGLVVKGCKRGFYDEIDGCEKWVLSINGGHNGHFIKDCVFVDNHNKGANDAKAQVVGWPPIRSFRKNTMAFTSAKNNENTPEKSASECLYVKVSMDGAPYLRKVDLRNYTNYTELSSALEMMFTCFITGQYGSHGLGERDEIDGHSTDHLGTSEYVLTYEDKDGDWMLVGDVPWKMFVENCRKLRIMKGSEAIGLAPNAVEKCKIQVKNEVGRLLG
ncbi:hypothetical protein RND81_09G113300 [Saponaria officinalis]|uniref:Auxin-responsive protein n=1 Tax=Saponaria officinalis TaxID=3572 RepID=A0AAW1IJG5_SAPOF